MAAFDCCERTRQYEFGHDVLKKGLNEVKASLSADNFFSINCMLMKVYYYCLSLSLFFRSYEVYGYSLYLLGKFTEAVTQMRQCLAACPRSSEGVPFLVRSNFLKKVRFFCKEFLFSLRRYVHLYVTVETRKT